MRIIFALVLLIGVSIAGGAVYLAMERFNQYETALANRPKNSGPPIEMVNVFVTTKELRYGQKLAREDVRTVSWPKDGVPETAFTSAEALFGAEDKNELRTVLRVLDIGEAILATKVTGIGQDAGVSARLKAGMRAFALRVDVASGVSGFLRPGDRVDVYWSGDDKGQSVTKLIMEDITLVAIDQEADEDRNRPTVARTVTAEVSPRVVGALVQAQSTGRLLLSLRGASDDGESGTIEITQDDLLGRQSAQAVEKKVCKIRTRKGSEVIEIPIPCTD